MKKIFITLILGLTFTISKATEKEILVNVVFENLTNKAFTSGEFTIINSNQKIEINSIDGFKITLPTKGKYQFSFTSDDFTAYTFYPKRITNRKNTITIRLIKKSILSNSGGIFSFPIDLDTNLTNEQIEKRILDGTLNFIMHGIDNSIPTEYVVFKEKYGIGLTKKNCVIDPLSYQQAIENNQMIFNYLNKKYGSKWLAALNAKPLGIK